ncbi:hypothetical protein BaRGS_00014407, partial [Batillaria attramentaria]
TFCGYRALTEREDRCLIKRARSTGQPEEHRRSILRCLMLLISITITMRNLAVFVLLLAVVGLSAAYWIDVRSRDRLGQVDKGDLASSSSHIKRSHQSTMTQPDKWTDGNPSNLERTSALLVVMPARGAPVRWLLAKDDHRNLW